MSEPATTKRVTIYIEISGGSIMMKDEYAVGENGVTNISYNHRTVKIEFENGEHRHISGFPFEFVSPKPSPSILDDTFHGQPKIHPLAFDKELLAS